MRGTFFRKLIKSKPIVFTGAVLLLLTVGIIVAACASAAGDIGMAHESTYEKHDTGFVIAEPGSYDSEDTAVIKEINTENGKITFMNIDTGKYYTLTYDGTTVVQDKYGSAMSVSQVEIGNIVDVNFLRGKKKLSGMKLTETAWEYGDIQKFKFDSIRKNAEIGENLYNLQNGMVVLYDGKEAQIEDVVKGDTISISGIDHNVYSIVLEKGHGYLKLSNDEYLTGGWIEVGQTIIQQITQDMLLTVPEGTYDVHLTAKGIDETRQITVYRGQEVMLDVSDIKAEAPQMGKIIFAVTPSMAKVYIDGTEVDITAPVELEYGVHQMIVMADGYDSVTQYIKVRQELASISVTLEESEEGVEEEKTPTVSGNEMSTSYRVYIDSPSDVEVYLDGIYMGISPVNFKKEQGIHTITFRKNGYVTKSYTIQIDGEEKDVTYSFTDLVKESGPTVSGNVPKKDTGSVSDNSVSGNSVSGNK